MNFIKDLVENNPNELAHKKFIRFGLGTFERESMIIKKSKSFVAIQCGFEYLDVMYRFIAGDLEEPVVISGSVISSKDQMSSFESLGIEPSVRGKKYTISTTELSSEKFKELLDMFANCFVLLSLKSGKYSIKVKKALPKPGKLVEKFATIKFPLDKFDDIVLEFLFDADKKPEAVATIKTTYVIKSIDIPKEYEDDHVQARLNAIRKGKIIREIDIDGNITTKEYDFEA